jgi:hypothetical protein
MGNMPLSYQKAVVTNIISHYELFDKKLSTLAYIYNIDIAALCVAHKGLSFSYQHDYY